MLGRRCVFSRAALFFGGNMRKTSDSAVPARRGSGWGIAVRTAVAVILAAGLVWVNLSLRFTAGSLIGTLILGAALCLTVFFKPISRLTARIWRKIPGRILLCFFGAVITAGLFVCAFFSVNMAVYAANPPLSEAADTDCVIVLGCQVKGETPTSMLCDRLNAALELLRSSESTLCVVSGGKGNGEAISEAEAMRRYLLENGISDKRIIPEPGSHSTEENLRFSAALLRERGFDGRITIVTNEYHQYRAHIYAEREGLNVSHYSAATIPRLIPNSWVREWAALAVAFLKG